MEHATTTVANRISEVQHRVRPPKPVRTAFAFFVQDNFVKIARQLNTRSPLPVMKVLARKWKKA
uniref:HMG box domain-containing protein n=1 Tax=Romanomermis culicivorax TaxID=13658 RepID=A0A915LAY9_ROMCU